MRDRVARGQWKTCLLALLFIASLAGPLRAEKYLGKTVTVHYRETRKAAMTGVVVDEVEGRRIRINDPRGFTVWVELTDVERVDVQKSPKEEFAGREAACRAAKSADKWVELAKWCGLPEVKLPEERQRCLQEAIKLDKDHAGARAELGQMKDENGEWISAEEYYRKKGMVVVDGKPMTPEEAARVKAQKSGLARGLAGRLRESEGVPWAEAQTLNSPRKTFIVKCNSTKEVAKRYLQVLEKLHDKYTELLKDYPALYTGPSKVYIFRNRQEFRDFTMVGLGIGGYFQPLDRAVRAFHGSFGPTGNTDMVLAHEATHQFQHRIMKEMMAVPVWLLEGMAVYFGDGSRIRPDGAVELNVIPRMRLQSLQQAITTEHYVPLEKLLRIRMVGSNTAPCYDHGWGVIYWCLQGDKYKNGHKGEGRKIWTRYLDHVTKEIKRPFPQNHWELEAKYFTDLITKETGKSIEEWEEGFKSFIMALPLDALGKWTGRQWDGLTKVGVQFTLPEGLSPVKELDLRLLHQEAAAGTTENGVRLWLVVADKLDQPSEDALQAFVRGQFYDIDFVDEFREEEYKQTMVNGVQEVYVTAFRGKQAVRREATVQATVGPDEKGKSKKKSEKAEKPAKKDAGDAPKGATGAPGGGAAPSEIRVRVALFSTIDRFHIFCLTGPEAPFSKIEPKFEDLLKSVKLDYKLR